MLVCGKKLAILELLTELEIMSFIWIFRKNTVIYNYTFQLHLILSVIVTGAWCKCVAVVAPRPYAASLAWPTPDGG